MLSNTVTLAVDVLGNNALVNQTITRSEEFQNRSRYKFATNSLLNRDQVDFYRTFPKRAGNFNGVAKSSFKLTTDIEVSGVDTSTSLIAPLIGEVSFSLPVGAVAADILLLRQRMIAVLDNAIAAQLCEELEI